MTQLSDSEKQWLEQHGVALTDVFDGSGFTLAGLRTAMKSCGAVVAYGTSPCKAAGHRLRDRHHHCVQCNSKNLAFQSRHQTPGWIYCFHSDRINLYKVGMTALSQSERLNELNRDGYAGTDDWKAHYWPPRRIQNAGRLEALIHKHLSGHQTSRIYVRSNGQTQSASELYSCTDVDFKGALLRALNEYRST